MQWFLRYDANSTGSQIKKVNNFLSKFKNFGFNRHCHGSDKTVYREGENTCKL